MKNVSIKLITLLTLVLVNQIIIVNSCDVWNDKYNCCDDNECTGEICLKGCGRICCKKLSYKIYDFICKGIVKFIAASKFPILGCRGWGMFAYEICAPEAAPFLIWGQIGCVAVGLTTFGTCSVYESALVEPLCQRMIKKSVPNKRTLQFLGEQIDYPKFPESFSMNVTSVLGDQKKLFKTSITKTKEKEGVKVLYKSKFDNSSEGIYLFHFKDNGRTWNLTEKNCTVTTGVVEPLDKDFLEYILAKFDIQTNLQFDSIDKTELNETCNVWKTSKILNDTENRLFDFFFYETSEKRIPRKIKIVTQGEEFMNLLIEDFKENVSIDYENEIFSSCDECKKIKSCEEIESLPQCGWCPSTNLAYSQSLLPLLNFDCAPDKDKGQWTTKANNCACLKAKSCEDIINTDCGWCPELKKAYIGTEKGPNDFSCPISSSSGQWTFYSNDCKCLSANKCEDIKNTNCGWCPSLSKAFKGNDKGPEDGILCPLAQNQDQWIWRTNDCNCLNSKKCEDIENTNCGWCPSLNKAFIGDFNNPFYDVKCSSSLESGQWTFYSNDCKCQNAKKCEDIKNTNCGWCPSLNKALIGNEKGPANGIVCPISDKGEQWIWRTNDCNCSNAKKCEDIENSNCGWCPSLNKAFIGNIEGPLNNFTCEQSLEKGQWTFYSNDCKCSSLKNCEEIKNTNCGWCPSLNKAFIGDEKGLKGKNLVCPQSKNGDQWIKNYIDCKCLSVGSCEDIEETNCGWCPSQKKAFLGNYDGPFGDKKCEESINDGQWTFYSKDCKCLNAKKCEDIVERTNCGWCSDLNRAFIGNEKGPKGNIECNGKWIISAKEC